MIASLKKLTTAATLAAILSSSLYAASPGFVDFGKFDPVEGEQYVEVDINASLLGLAAAFARGAEPEIANLIGSLERVRVNVIGVKDHNRSETTDRINAIRGQLEGDGWNRVVTVREKAGDDVAVFVKENGGDAIHGVVVTVLSRSGEAVFVNVVGNVEIEQLAKLGDSLDIKPLRQLKLKHAES